MDVEADVPVVVDRIVSTLFDAVPLLSSVAVSFSNSEQEHMAIMVVIIKNRQIILFTAAVPFAPYFEIIVSKKIIFVNSFK